MTFLAVMALAASFALGNMTERWSSGLKNSLTIEIPAEDEDGKLRSEDVLTKLSDQVFEKLQSYSALESVEVLSQDQVNELIEPWLGSGLALTDIPLPGLVSITLRNNEKIDMDTIQFDLAKISENIRIDTHQEWLGDVLKFANTLQMAAFIVTFIVALTTVIAVASAIRSRIAEYKSDVQLLHFMGASDDYITRQFQRHAFMIGLEGGLIGLVSGGLIIAIFSAILSSNGGGVLPSFVLNSSHVAILLFLPVLICLLTSLTARRTVLAALSEMP
jgi:cell division transport system permease protein